MIPSGSSILTEYLSDIGSSLVRAAVGLSIGIITGLIAAAITSSNLWFDRLFGNALRFSRSIPALAMAPFVLLVFGISEAGRFFLISWGTFFPIWISAHAGMSNTDPQILRLGSEVYHSRWKMYLLVRIPSAIPYVLAGIRVSIGVSLILLVAAEMMGANSGVIARMLIYQQVFRLDLVCVQLVILGALGLSLDRAYVLLARRFAPWVDL